MFAKLALKTARVAVMGTAGASLLYMGAKSIEIPQVHASSNVLEPTNYKWSHSMPWQGYDHARYVILKVF